jgi:hypothetical protein|nr:MAG TPA: hypothetical protein [Caudoviricetes sp.]
MDRRITVNPAAVYDELDKIHAFRSNAVRLLALLNEHPDESLAKATAPFALATAEFLDSLNALEDLMTEEWDGDDEDDLERIDE